MDIKFASKGIMCALGFITLGAVSVSASAQSTEYRRGYDQGYRDGIAAQGRQGQQDEPRARIYIEDAQYGTRDASCDATDAVKQAVGRHRHVSIRANNQLCGDPARGSQKRLRITYRCDDGAAFRVRASEGENVTINCR